MLRAAAVGTWKNNIHKQFKYLHPAAAFLTYFSNRSLLVVVVLAMSDECEYLTPLEMSLFGVFHRSYFLRRVTIVEFTHQYLLKRWNKCLSCRNSFWRFWTAEEFTTAVFASSTCSHRSLKLISLHFLYSRSPSVLGPDNNPLTRSRNQDRDWPRLGADFAVCHIVALHII